MRRSVMHADADADDDEYRGIEWKMVGWAQIAVSVAMPGCLVALCGLPWSGVA